MQIIKFLKDLVSNPDGTGSTKRSAGQIVLIATLVLVFVFPTHAAYEFSVGALLTFAGGLFGLSSLDYNNFLTKEKEKQI